jgi:hypothetical protein
MTKPKRRGRPATPAEAKFLAASIAGDSEGIHSALVEMHRDPALWFCSACEGGMPRFGAWGNTREEAERAARAGAEQYTARKGAFRVVGEWKFTTYAPDPDRPEKA